MKEMRSDLQTIEWLGMQIHVPADWEIVRHSVNQHAGSLIMVDRRRQRMQLSWTECASPPDEKRIFEDFRSRDLKENPGCKLEDVFQCGPFTCYRRITGPFVVTRAGMYDRRWRRWVDVAIPWPEGREEALEGRILESFRTAQRDAKTMRWRAFRLDFLLPSQWRLCAADVRPGRVTMSFEHDGITAAVTRVGAVDGWFDGHLDHYLKKQVDNAVGTYTISKRGQHEACVFTGKERRFHPRWLMGRRRVRSDIAWHCPDSKALYQVMIMGRAGADMLVDMVQVNCCGGRTDQ